MAVNAQSGSETRGSRALTVCSARKRAKRHSEGNAEFPTLGDFRSLPPQDAHEPDDDHHRYQVQEQGTTKRGARIPLMAKSRKTPPITANVTGFTTERSTRCCS